MHVLVYTYMRKVCVYMCVNIYMRVYAYIYACIYMGEYVRVWLISNFLIALTGDIIFLSQLLLLWCTLHEWYSHAPQPCAPTVDHQPTTRTRI